MLTTTHELVHSKSTTTHPNRQIHGRSDLLRWLYTHMNSLLSQPLFRKKIDGEIEQIFTTRFNCLMSMKSTESAMAKVAEHNIMTLDESVANFMLAYSSWVSCDALLILYIHVDFIYRVFSRLENLLHFIAWLQPDTRTFESNILICGRKINREHLNWPSWYAPQGVKTVLI